MSQLKDLLKAYLRIIHPRVYYENAPESATYPYLIFDFPNELSDGESVNVVVVDIDGWDRPADGDVTLLEAIMEAVNGDGDAENPTGLNKETLTAEKIAVTFYLDRKLNLRDDDKRIKRRKYIYQARLFERS